MGYCQGLTKKGKPCRLKGLENGYCKPHQDQFTPEITPETPETPEIPFTPEVQTAVLTPEDRVLRYRMNPKCPECGAHPTVCMLRRKNYGLFRCRVCGSPPFEIDRNPVKRPLDYMPGKEGQVLFKRFQMK